MADFRDTSTGEIISIPDSESADIETLRARPEDFEEIEPSAQSGQQVAQPERNVSQVESLARGAGQGLTLGFSDELEALGSKAGDWLARQTRNLGYRATPQTYGQAVAEQRAANAAAEQANPKTYMAGDIAGSVALPMPGMAGMKGASLAARLGRQAAVGAGTGLVEGAGRADSPEGLVSTDTAKKAVIGAGVGGLGAAGGEAALTAGKGLTRGVGRVIGSKVDPDSAIMQYTKRIEDTAKRQAGPSPDERVAEIEGLIGEHGRALKENLAENIQTQVQDDLSGIVRSNDVVMTQANTSLKGTAAMKALGAKLESVSPENRARFQQAVLDKADQALNKIRETLGKIKQRAKGRLAAPSAGTQASQVDTAIESYEKLLAQIETSGSNDPTSIADTYIALDKVKRALGNAQGKIRGDKTSQETLRKSYMELRGFLENEKVWGPEVTGMQKDLNRAWSKYLEVENAVEASFMKGRSKQALTAEDTFDKLTEAEGTKVKGFLSDPSSATNKADRRNLQKWLDASEELTGVLTKYYRDIPGLQNEVARIQAMRSRVLENINRAASDVARNKRPGAKALDQVAEDLAIARKRGIPEGESARAIPELQNQRNAIVGDDKARLAQEHQYARDVRKKTGELYDIDPVFGKIRTGERVLKSTLPGASARFGSAEYMRSVLGASPSEPVDETENQTSHAKREVLLNRAVERNKNQKERMTTQ